MCGLLGCVRQRVGDVVEDGEDALAGCRHGRDRDGGDPRAEHRVFEQVLTLLVAGERLDGVHELHDILPFRVAGTALWSGALRRGRVTIASRAARAASRLPHRNVYATHTDPWGAIARKSHYVAIL